MRIAVISDVHAARAPFDHALCAARATGFDELVILGDLFTYGLEPRECADLAAEAVAKDGAILVGGNHDQLYLDLERGDRRYYEAMPNWIRETADWTWARLGGRWPEELQCTADWSVGELLLAHANPFGEGDWTYLSNEALLARAADTCARRGYRYGVFGHLHRVRHFAGTGCDIHVVGSIGQPRSREDRVPHWTMISMADGAFDLERHDVPFDAAAHCAAIRSEHGLSAPTRSRLCGFFEP